MKLTWLQVTSMEQRGVVAAETISVLLMKPFLIVPCLRHRAPRRCGDPDPDVCGFLKPPVSQRFWRVNKHGAFSIPRKHLGLRPSDQSCHHETWLHLDFVDLQQQVVQSSLLQL